MERFTVHTGTAVPLRRSNVDTDQIVPSDFLKRTGRTGFADGLFAGWRHEPGFPLTDPRYAGATVLLAGPDFGIGSSREHAVWALQDWGFRAVVSARFGDIFRANALAGGLLPVTLPAVDVDRLMGLVEGDPAVPVVVDLVGRRLSAGPLDVAFDLEDFLRWRLMEGLDDIDLTLRHEEDIATFERRRRQSYPVTIRPVSPILLPTPGETGPK
jgi:3-isopropylmalate/(R)-2-methylmalate dehydratase small subunit